MLENPRWRPTLVVGVLTAGAFYRSFSWILIPLTVGALGGCRDVAPPPTGVPVGGSTDEFPPTVRTAWVHPSLATGQAELVPFRPFGSERKNGAVGNSGQENESEMVEGEIRAFLEDYHAVLNEKDVEESAKFFVAGQQASAQELTGWALALTKELEQLRKSLEEKLPDSLDRIAAAFEPISDDGRLNIQDLRVVSRDEAVARLSLGGPVPECRFVREEGEWYLEYPNLPAVESLKPAFDQALQLFQALNASLVEGTSEPLIVLAQVEAMASAAKAMRGVADQEIPTPPGDAGDGGP